MLKSIFRQGLSKEPTDAATKLLQTLADSFSPEDRIKASSDLRNTLIQNASAKSAISSFGLESICSVVRNSWEEEEVVRNCLECLAIVIDISYSENLAECKVNAEQLARTPGAIGLLFDSLEYSRGSGQERFHIQYFALQTLKSIFETNGAFCQHASLKLTNSITGPLKLLKGQEVLRNDSILLLQCLVFKSNIAQNIAVREGCLEEIFSIYEDEDPQINYAVIEDSLTLLRYLLQDNLDAQAIFCSSDAFDRYLSHLQTRISRSTSGMTMEQSRILSSEIGILFPFICSQSIPNKMQPLLHRRTNEESSVLTKMLLSLVQLQGNIEDLAFSATAWDCLLELSKIPSIRDDVLGSTVYIQGQPASIQLGSLYITLTSQDPVHQMSCMRFCISSLWFDTSRQDQCVRQLFASSNIAGMLFGETQTTLDLLFRSRCLISLAPLCLQKDNRTKLQSIKYSGKSLTAFGSGILAKTILEFGKVPEAREICLNCSIFLSCITKDSPGVVQDFLSSISERPFLVGVLLSDSQFGDNEKILKGVCSLLLGLAMNAPETSSINPKVLEETIKEKIGLSNFIGNVNFLTEQTSEFDQASLFNGIVPRDIFLGFTNQIKAKFYPTSAGALTAQVSPPVASVIPTPSQAQVVQPKQEEPPLDSSTAPGTTALEKTELKNMLDQKEEHINSLTEKLRKTEDDLKALSDAYSALDQHSCSIQKQLEEAQQKPEPLLDNPAIEDLLVCLGQQEEKNAKLVAKLQAMGIDIEGVLSGS